MDEELNLEHFDLGTFVDYVHALKQERDALRAQLPSQGGEAVAWRVTGRGGITVTGQYPEWAEADCLLTITPLYTHPADQVSDDPIMVKVPRELANIAALHLENSGYTETGKKLRALLEPKL